MKSTFERIKMGEELEEGKAKQLYLLFRDYNLLDKETDYVRQAMFMLDLIESPTSKQLSKQLELVSSRMCTLANAKKVELERELGFFV